MSVIPNFTRNAKTVRRPPGPPEWPVVGSLPAFARDPLEFLEDAVETYGDSIFMHFGPYPAYLFVDSDHIEHILLRSWRSLHKDVIYDDLKRLLGEGLVTSEGTKWRRQRKLAAPSFQPTHLTNYGDIMVSLAREMVTEFRSGQIRDIHTDLMELTLDIILATVFGTDTSVDSQLVGDCMETFMEAFVFHAQGPGRLIPEWIPTPGRIKLAKAIQALDDQVLPIIRQRQRSDEEKEDLMGRLLAARDEDGRRMTEEELRDEVMTLFVAGHETTALALTYSVILLSEHPETRARLEREVDAVLGGEPPTVADMGELEYTEAVIKEAMRVYPPVWAIGREVIEEIEVGEYQLPVGSQILMSQWINHHREEWFEEPSKFKPERWLSGLEEELPRFAYFPFGGGPRICIGNHFAMMEAILVLATIVQSVSLRWTADPPLDLYASVTLRPKDAVNVEVTER